MGYERCSEQPQGSSLHPCFSVLIIIYTRWLTNRISLRVASALYLFIFSFSFFSYARPKHYARNYQYLLDPFPLSILNELRVSVHSRHPHTQQKHSRKRVHVHLGGHWVQPRSRYALLSNENTQSFNFQRAVRNTVKAAVHWFPPVIQFPPSATDISF